MVKFKITIFSNRASHSLTLAHSQPNLTISIFLINNFFNFLMSSTKSFQTLPVHPRARASYQSLDSLGPSLPSLVLHSFLSTEQSTRQHAQSSSVAHSGGQATQASSIFTTRLSLTLSLLKLPLAQLPPTSTVTSNPHNDDTPSPSSLIYSVVAPSPAIVSPPSTLDRNVVCPVWFVSLLPSFFSPFSCEGHKVHLETLIRWSNLLLFIFFEGKFCEVIRLFVYYMLVMLSDNCIIHMSYVYLLHD